MESHSGPEFRKPVKLFRAENVTRYCYDGVGTGTESQDLTHAHPENRDVIDEQSRAEQEKVSRRLRGRPSWIKLQRYARVAEKNAIDAEIFDKNIFADAQQTQYPHTTR
jgi:hypothetical protein